MTKRKHESELDTFYTFAGTILPLYVDGRYSNHQIIDCDIPEYRRPVEIIEVFNLSETPLFYCKPDGVVGVVHSTHQLKLSHVNALTREETQTLRDTIGELNAYGGVLIRVRNRNQSYQFPERCRPAFATVEPARMPDPTPGVVTYAGAAFDYYIHINAKALKNAVEGVFVPQIGYTVSWYYSQLNNHFLTERGLGTYNNQPATGWYFVLDTDDRSYERLWFKMGEHFEEVVSIGRGSASETIKVYRYGQKSQPILVAKIDVDVAIKEGFKFDYGDNTWFVPFFVNKQTATEWRVAQDAARNADLEELREQVRKAEQAQRKAEANTESAENKFRKAEQAKTETKDNFWFRAVSFVIGIIPAVIKLVTYYFTNKK